MIENFLPSNKRSLTKDEIKILIQNHNYSQSWDSIHVSSESFDPSLIKNCTFYGIVYLGRINPSPVLNNGIQIIPGITNSTIQNSIIQDNCTIHSCGLCANYLIEKQVVILNVSEISSNESASFGEGVFRKNELSLRFLSIINENGRRKIIPFSGYTCSDAWMITTNNHNPLFKARIEQILKNSIVSNSNSIAKIGENSRVFNTTAIRNCVIHESSIIDGAQYLEDSTILSDFTEPTIIKSGVEVTNSIIGYGNNLRSSCLLNSSITGTAVSISQSARISESFIGDNSEISCCEIAHSFVFPFHNQHHNNSFLIASCIGGQSNIAAGSTVGSNHNSRVNDGELWASRGFWPGLCTSFKHNSKFASFTTCAKADYPSEINLPYPFSLISNDMSSNALVVYPAWSISSNLYSLMRSRQKFIKRDKRVHKNQIIEPSPFAPDTIKEVFNALELIELHVGSCWYKNNTAEKVHKADFIYKGRELLSNGGFDQPLELEQFTIEKSKRKVTLMKPGTAWRAYKLIVEWFSLSTIAFHDFEQVISVLETEFSEEDAHWVNAGGQIIRKSDVSAIIKRIIQDDSIIYWDQVRKLFSGIYKEYPVQHLKFALNALFRIHDVQFEKNRKILSQLIVNSITSIDSVLSLTTKAREKDFQDPFRLMVYSTKEESQFVLGTIKDDPVICSLEIESLQMRESLNQLLKKLKD